MCKMENRTETARRFVAETAARAKQLGLDFFIVTDGASGISNDGNPAVDHAREMHMEWERAHGIDPQRDWAAERKEINPCV